MRKRRLSANAPSIEASLRSKATPPIVICGKPSLSVFCGSASPIPRVCVQKTHAGKGKEKKDSESNNCANAGNARAKANALLMALVLCMGMTPHAAWAEETGETGGSSAPRAVEQPTVTLTIVNGFGYFGPNVLVNNAYSFTEGQTLADLFAAAKAAGDIKDYEFSNPYGYGEYLASVMMPDDTVVSDPTGAASYWANFKNGSYASGAACQAGDKLAAGDAFQFAFTDLVVNRAPSADEWAVLKGKAEGVAPSKPGQSGSTNQGKPSTANSNKYDAAKAETLIANLSARFAINGKDHAIDNNTFYAAIALNSFGKGASIDAAAILANLNKDDLMTAGRMGKYIMALTAAGIGCTKVNDNGAVRNLVAEMEALEKPESMSVYDAVCILPVYQYGSYKQGDSAMAPSALIDLILANADDKGLFGSLTYGCDTQTTAQAILALLPYQSFHSGAAAAIKKAESALLSMDNEDGSFAYSAQYREANLDATANVVAALEALGYNCASDSRLTTSNGSTPLGYLTSVADKDLTGYLDSSSYNESATSAVVLMAFAAHEGARQADGAYSVYTFKQVTKDDSNSGSNQDSGSNSDSDAKPLAQTGDDAATAAAAAIALCAIALCALASGAVAVRRVRRFRTLA